MVMVRAKVAHTNEFGTSIEKAIGDTYEIDDGELAGLLSRQNIVEIIADKPTKAKDETAQG
jgi:hypothetical protein